MSPKRFTVHLGLTVLSFAVPAVWTGCNRLVHPAPPVVAAPVSSAPLTAGSGTGLPGGSLCGGPVSEASPVTRDATVQAACDAAQLVQELNSTP